MRAAVPKSNHELCDLGTEIQWQEFFVGADKMFCVYLAKDEALIRRHAEQSGFPATRITEIGKVIDPTTALNHLAYDRSGRSTRSFLCPKLSEAQLKHPEFAALERQ